MFKEVAVSCGLQNAMIVCLGSSNEDAATLRQSVTSWRPSMVPKSRINWRQSDSTHCDGEAPSGRRGRWLLPHRCSQASSGLSDWCFSTTFTKSWVVKRAWLATYCLRAFSVVLVNGVHALVRGLPMLFHGGVCALELLCCQSVDRIALPATFVLAFRAGIAPEQRFEAGLVVVPLKANVHDFVWQECWCPLTLVLQECLLVFKPKLHNQRIRDRVWCLFMYRPSTPASTCHGRQTSIIVLEWGVLFRRPQRLRHRKVTKDRADCRRPGVPVEVQCPSTIWIVRQTPAGADLP